MTEKKSVLKCQVCGIVVEVLNQGQGTLICCGNPMKLQEEKEKDEGSEKHVPVAEKKESGLVVKVGEVAHPMEEGHFIQWIEVSNNNSTYRKELKPGEEPMAEFSIPAEGAVVRSYCNLHGLWKS